MIINTPCRKCLVTNVSLVISPLCMYIGKVGAKAVLCTDLWTALWTEFGLSLDRCGTSCAVLAKAGFFFVAHAV